MNAEFYFSIPSYVKEKDKSLKHLNQQVVFKQVRKEIIGLKLEEYQLIQGIPTILIEIVKFFINNVHYLQQEGVFRKASSINKESELENILKGENYAGELQQYEDPNAVAGIFKKIFDKMRTNLITNEEYKAILAKKKESAAGGGRLGVLDEYKGGCLVFPADCGADPLGVPGKLIFGFPLK